MKTLIAFLLLVLGSPAFAQTATVTTTDDIVDFGGAQQIADLPGPDGLVSFREAVTAANNTIGPQTIEFAVPNNASNEWTSGVAMLYMGNGIFSLTDDETTVDFTTQTAFTGDTNPAGNEVGIRTIPPYAGLPGIYISADRCTVKGLDRLYLHGYGVEISGNDNRVVGCTISGPFYAGVYVSGLFNGPPATGNVVGGTLPGEGNVLSSGNAGVRIDGPAEDNVVIGNALSGLYFAVEVRTPNCCPGNEAINNRIGGPTEAERNVINGAGHYGEEGFPLGGMVDVEYSTGTIIEGNYLGVNADGVSVPSGQRGTRGIELRESPGTIIRNNLIGGILVVGVNHYAGQRFGTAIYYAGDCTGSVIEGNVIGNDPTGTIPLPNRYGIEAGWWVGGATGPVRIGGTQPGQANSIAFSEETGVRISLVEGMRISGNSIHDNGDLGIDLLDDSGWWGQTPNDPGDGDGSGNLGQNYPVLSSVSVSPGSTTISGSLDSNPNRAFDLEFFGSAVCDPSGFGEGEMFLGTVSVTTDGAGIASFNVSLPTELPARWFVTATATEASTGNTSEFSACKQGDAGLTLAVDPLVRGQTSDWTVDGAIPGETVHYLYSLAGTGAGPCPSKLGGLCLDLLTPITVAGNAVADGGGTAVLTVPIPASVPLITVHIQAVARRGPGGADSVKSNPVSTTIQ